MKILWFSYGGIVIRFKVIEKDIFIATSAKGINNFFKVNTKEVSQYFNEDEKREFDNLKDEKEVTEEIKRELGKKGFRLMKVE